MEQVGNGFPSGPLGISPAGGSLDVSTTLRAEGRERNVLGSVSSFFTVTSSFPAPFPLVGVGKGVKTLCFPLSVESPADPRREDAERSARLVGVHKVSAFSDDGGVTSCGFGAAGEVDWLARAFCWRVEMIERKGEESPRLGVDI